ncbi:RabGAP/TBC [Xylona heveae TC161]|uniref:RabGAP/TBC n=1 Tax=Xylona heveae (strain CBS 132557 / TC161) TaxID=1328760 RepID=A0A165GIE6_XYLHT|nr:RabGAP/TBC [Xylona heveae TC161]KZF22220.1 RabGAP/TBC [Xylona heveae TC161]
MIDTGCLGMKSREDLQKRWRFVAESSSISSLKSAVRKPANENPCICGFRSICWKIFLLFQDFDHLIWNQKLLASRRAYDSLRQHFFRNVERPNNIDSEFDPLTEDENSPWTNIRQDEALREEILQDVERCMPDYEYFHQREPQTMMLDILFVFCKLNPDVGYRQGMHEVLAPLLWVVKEDAINTGLCPSETEDSSFVGTMLDETYIEHDSFTLFNLLMQSAKPLYDAAPSTPKQPITFASKQSDSFIVQSIKNVYYNLLPQVDPELSDRLYKAEIVPQVFLLRWFRLIFGREFPLENLLPLWDLILAEDPQLDLLQFICVAMLLRVRWHLLEAEPPDMLIILLRYPIPPENIGAQTFVDDAIYLRTHLDIEGGSYIIAKYSNRTPKYSPGKRQSYSRVSALQFPAGKDKAELRSLSPSQSSSISSPEQRGLENFLQDAARGVYRRSEKWGLSNIVRNTVEEMRKGVQNLPTSTPTKAQVSDAVQGKPKSQICQDYVDNSLTPVDLLKDALIGLRECEEEIKQINRRAAAKLRLAADKVENAQRMFEDVPRKQIIQTGSEESGGRPEGMSLFQQHTSVGSSDQPKSPPVQTQTSSALYPSKLATLPAGYISPNSPKGGQLETQPVESFQSPRRSLAQSSFSWMVEGEQRTSNGMSNNPLRTGKRNYEQKNKVRSFLFGESGPQESSQGEDDSQEERFEV